MRMRKLVTIVGLLCVAAVLIGCDGGPSPTGPSARVPEIATPLPTATPTPTPAPVSLVGLWKIANEVPEGHPMAGYAIELADYDPVSGRVLGRVVLKFSLLTGLLRGTARHLPDGRLHIDWSTDFSGQGDTENGSMDCDLRTGRMEGQVIFEFQSFDGERFTFRGVVLRRVVGS